MAWLAAWVMERRSGCAVMVMELCGVSESGVEC